MKPTQEEMLEYLTGLQQSQDGEYVARTPQDRKKEQQLDRAIRDLIENKPKVSKEFVEKYTDILSPKTVMGLHNETAINHLWWREQIIRDMFREAGVEVEK
jgi:hypothetical protein